ncbi:MAG: hypothetical protein V4507_13605 [Verrucomicrobiota bacterium]
MSKTLLKGTLILASLFQLILIIGFLGATHVIRHGELSRQIETYSHFPGISGLQGPTAGQKETVKSEVTTFALYPVLFISNFFLIWFLVTRIKSS